MGPAITVLLLMLALFAAYVLIFRRATPQAIVEKIANPAMPVYTFSCPERQIAEIAPTVECLRVSVSDGSVKVVRSSEVSKISVRAAYKGNYRIDGNSVEQIKQSGAHLWQSEQGQYRLYTWTGAAKDELPSYRVSVNGDKVQVDGKDVRVVYLGDNLEILVPQSYKGGLEIESTDGGQIDLSEWSDGDVVIKASGDISVQDLARVTSLKVQLSGRSDGNFGKIDCSGSVEIDNESGSFTSSDIKAGNGLALTSGDGSVTAGDINLGGNIKITTGDGSFTCGDIASVEGSLEFTSSGYGDIGIGNVKVANATFDIERENAALTGKKFEVGVLSIETSSTGDINLDEIAGRKCEFTINANSSVVVETIEVDTFRFTSTDIGDLTVTTLTAHENCDIDLQPGNNCNVTMTTLESAFTKLRCDGDGDFNIDNINGANCSVELLGDGDLTVDEVDLTGEFTLTQSDDGDASISTLKAPTVSCESTNNGDLTVSNVEANEAKFSCTGDRSITVEDGTCGVLWLKAENDGSVSASGSFDKIHTEKSGDGSISIG